MTKETLNHAREQEREVVKEDKAFYCLPLVFHEAEAELLVKKVLGKEPAQKVIAMWQDR